MPATALVTDAQRGSAVAVIRSLGRRGWRVIAAESHPLAAGMYSRYAAGRLRLPPPRSEPEAMAEALLGAVRSEGVDLVVPVTDDVALPLAAARHRFAGLCALALPDDAQLAVVNDKLATTHLAGHVGVPVPSTTSCESVAEARSAAGALGWPVVVKPRLSRVYIPGRRTEAFTASYAATVPELEGRVGELLGRVPVLLQEYCPGDGVGVEMLTHRGRPLAAFQHRRLREVPPSGGASSLRESEPLDAELYGHARRLLAALDWTGLAMVEFKVGADGPRLLEVNGRIWGSLPLAVMSRMDFPARLGQLHLDGPPANGAGPDASYAVGVRSRDLELELRWMASVWRGDGTGVPVPHRRAALRAGLGLFRPEAAYDVLSVDDPLPGMAEVITLLARGGRALARRVMGPGP
ncbi:MAG TPA: ATP-grasp domain-containing protein [Acidimicrobiales bacterium]|nr:ATP-grasp domain-containing protein [Acidimicrobiales bacterium]